MNFAGTRYSAAIRQNLKAVSCMYCLESIYHNSKIMKKLPQSLKKEHRSAFYFYNFAAKLLLCELAEFQIRLQG